MKQRYHIVHEISHPDGQCFIVETTGEAEDEATARYHAEVVEENYPFFNGWQIRELKCVFGDIAVAEERDALERLLGDVKIDL